MDPDIMPRPLGQGLGQFLAVPRVHAEQDLMGQNGPRQIILAVTAASSSLPIPP